MPGRVVYKVTRANRKFIKSPQVLEQIEKTLKVGVKRDLIKSLDDVVADWSADSTPTWKDSFKKGDDYVLEIFSSGSGEDIFQYVDRGTEDHPITGNPMLFFNMGYQAKTKPGGRYGVGSGEATGASVMTASVQHPGNAARGFSVKISREYRTTLREKINAAIERGLD
jgi:hypothetical protein